MMVVAACTIELHLPGSGSLKSKRRVVKSLIARLRNEFNVSAAEVGAQDVWQSAIIGVVCVSSSQNYAHGLLTRLVEWVEDTRLDCDLIDYQIEFL